MRKLKLIFAFISMFYSFQIFSAICELIEPCGPYCVILQNQEDSGFVGNVGDEIRWSEMIKQAKETGKTILIPASGDPDRIPLSLRKNIVAVLKRKDEAGKPPLFIVVLKPFLSCV